MLLTIFAFYFGYKKAKATGRNAVLWSFICGLTFIGVQIIVPLAVGIFLGLGIGLFGWNENLYEDLTWPITFVGIGASIVALFILFKMLDRVPKEPTAELPPPPPPTFEQ
ncbi:MAG: hypothetical protein QM785_07550 [Pyrinomonadaceae bacterium]